MSTWIFLRGLMREARHWGSFPALFQREVPHASVLPLDLPGNGSLHGQLSPTRVQDMVEHCRRELSRQGMTPPYYLLGLSLGAMVAVAWSAAYADEISGCVLINASLRPYSPFYRRLRSRNYLALLRLALPGVTAKQREGLILRLTSCRRPAQQEVLDAWIAYAGECPVTRRNALRQLCAAAGYAAPMHKPAVPTLVLASACDRLVDPRCSVRVASAWQCALAIHADAGHDVPLDDGTWVAVRVREWLHASVA